MSASQSLAGKHPNKPRESEEGRGEKLEGIGEGARRRGRLILPRLTGEGVVAPPDGTDGSLSVQGLTAAASASPTAPVTPVFYFFLW